MAIWKVVGGVDKGGIVVRTRRDLKSSEEGTRLSTGSLVEEVQLVDSRLEYRLLSGSGPASGWVSIALKDKALLSKLDAEAFQHEAITGSAQQEKIGSVMAKVRRHENIERTPCCIILCAGNPGQQFGSDHMNSPLMTAIADALSGIGIPTICFHYTGVGLSAQEGAAGKTTDQQHIADVKDVAEWARKNVSDNVLCLGYSYGGSMSLPHAVAGCFKAFISVSLGNNVWWFMPEGEAQEALKRSMEEHSKISCPALYVVGSRDTMTPLSEVNRLVAARSDCGGNVQIRTVEQQVPPAKAHSFTNQEAEVGQVCAEFAAKMRLCLEYAPGAEKDA